MGVALELLTGIVTAPGTTLTALTMASGNSNTVRNTPPDADIRALTAWVDSQGNGILRVRSTKLHDNVQGIRLNHVASEVYPLLDPMFPQKLFPQDTLVLELSGSATAGDIETACLLVYYSDLPGVDARFISADDLKTRLRHIFTVENTLSAGTAGGYSGEEALNAEFDLFKANTDYAILGMITNVECAAIRLRGAETGNLGIGVPGNEANKAENRAFFLWLAERSGLPIIPVINSANKAGILLDCAQDENGSDPTVNTILAELAPA